MISWLLLGDGRVSLLIKNGTIVNASDLYRGDVFVENDVVTTIGSNLTMPADRTVTRHA